jgi:DNA-binding transcriptional LysR family regulator
MSDTVSWDDQRIFLAVLEGGSLSAAARALGVAQPTVRARLEALERGLGTVLFTRSPQGLLPTDQARALQGPVRAMDHASRAFLRAASGAPGEVRGTVRLSVAELVGVEVLPPMLAGLRARHPGLAVELDLSNLAANISEQAADVAVRMHPPSQDTLVVRKVGEVALGFFAHRDYLAARGQPATLEDFASHDLIGPDRSARDRRVAGALLPPAAMARFMIRTDSHPAQLAAARAGLGIAVMHRALGLADPRLVAVLPDFVVASLPVWVVTHRDLRHEPRIRATLDHLVTSFTSYCQDDGR